MSLGSRYFVSGEDAYTVPGQDVDRYPFRLLYSNQVPVPSRGYEALPGETLEIVGQVARAQAARDNAPGSLVHENLFFIQRWTGTEWDEYDAETDTDLADLAFGEGTSHES